MKKKKFSNAALVSLAWLGLIEAQVSGPDATHACRPIIIFSF